MPNLFLSEHRTAPESLGNTRGSVSQKKRSRGGHECSPPLHPCPLDVIRYSFIGMITAVTPCVPSILHGSRSPVTCKVIVASSPSAPTSSRR